MQAKRKQCTICPSDFVRIGARPAIRPEVVQLLRAYFANDGTRLLHKANEVLGTDANEAEFYAALARRGPTPKVREWLEQHNAERLF